MSTLSKTQVKNPIKKYVKDFIHDFQLQALDVGQAEHPSSKSIPQFKYSAIFSVADFVISSIIFSFYKKYLYD